MLNNLFIFFALILPFKFAWTTPIPHDVDIKSLRTPHFEILYYAKQQDLAEHYARQLERAHHFLKPFFSTQPTAPIPVVLNDSTDLANGFATRVPYAYSMLFPVMPDLNETLSEPHEWSLELTTHELAHVLSFEPALGVMKPLRFVFGSVVAPNLLLPNWWKEGLSVWTETAIGQGGRLRSTYQSAALRDWVGEKDLREENVAMANETLPSWPWGARPYLFGSLAMGYLVSQYGEDRSSELIVRHGSRVPYFLSGATQPVVQKNYEEIYNEALNFWQERAQAQVSLLQALPLDTPTQIQTGDITVRSPSFNSTKTHLAWVGQNEKPDNYLRVAELNEKGHLVKIENVFRQRIIREARFFPNSNKILINAILPAGDQQMYSDLYVFDLQTKKAERLTKKLRGREARVNALETLAVFVGLEGGKTHLRTLDLKNKNVKTYLSSNFDERIASPVFLDNSTVLFSWMQKGQESLWKIDLHSNSLERLPQWGPRMRRPVYKNSTLYFLSDLNGTFNLYKMFLNKNSNPVPLTHIKTTLLDFDLAPDSSAIVAQLTRQGPRLFQFESLSAKSKPLPVIKNNDVTFTSRQITSEPENIEIKSAKRSYKLWPHYWVPFVAGSSAKDGALVSISTSGHDPSLQHSYSAQVLYDTGTEDLSYDVNYTNLAHSFPWLLQSSKIVRSFAGSDTTYSNQVHAFSMTPDTSAWTDKFVSGFSLLYAKYDDDIRDFERFGPQASFTYNSADQSLWMISPESGSTLQLAATHYLKSADLNSYNQYRLKAATYMSQWLPARHAFMIDTKVLATDERIPSILGDGSTFFMNELTSNFLIRGYYEGQFIGRNLINANLEYRFPILKEHKGWGLFPFYIRRIHGAFAFDALTLDGFAYREDVISDVLVDRSQVFTSAGAEIRLDTTLGYILPLQAVIGVHQPLQKEFRKESNFLFQIKTNLTF